MPDRQQLLSNLRAEYDRWQTLLASLNEDQITSRNLPAQLSVKDVGGHLHAWQQVSIARLEAVVGDREPVLPGWLLMLQIAMMGKLPYPALRDGIFAHPTMAESLNTLFSSFAE